MNAKKIQDVKVDQVSGFKHIVNSRPGRAIRLMTQFVGCISCFNGGNCFNVSLSQTAV